MPSVKPLNEVIFRFHGHKRFWLPLSKEPINHIVKFHSAPSSWLLNDISIIVKQFLQSLPASANLSRRFKEIIPTLLEREKDLLLSSGEDTVILGEEEDQSDSEKVTQTSTDLFLSPKHSGTPRRPKSQFIVHIYSATNIEVTKVTSYEI